MTIEGFGDLVRQKSKEWETEGEYVERAIEAATNVFTILHEGNYSDSPIETSFIFDEESFAIEITYSGELLLLPQNRPESEQDLLDESPMSTGLKGLLAGIYPDKVTSKTEGTLCHIQLTYQV